MNKFRSAIQSGKGLHPADPVVRRKREHSTEADSLSSVEVPRQESRTHNQRDDDRHRLDRETATARHKGQTYEVDLINLSGGGAMISADFTPHLWDRIDLVLAGDAAIECAVRWLRGDRVGLEFAHETRIDCDPRVRDELLLDVIRRSFPDAALPPSEAPPAQPDDDDTITNSRRGERRHPLIWMGEIYWNHQNERVRLRNISENGALIESQLSLRQGAELLLDLGDAGQHFATVGWICGDKAGLAFAKQFDLKKLSRARPEVASSADSRPSYLRLSPEEASPWAGGWQRQSVEQLRDDLEGYLKR